MDLEEMDLGVHFPCIISVGNTTVVHGFVIHSGLKALSYHPSGEFDIGGDSPWLTGVTVLTLEKGVHS